MDARLLALCCLLACRPSGPHLDLADSGSAGESTSAASTTSATSYIATVSGGSETTSGASVASLHTSDPMDPSSSAAGNTSTSSGEDTSSGHDFPSSNCDLVAQDCPEHQKCVAFATDGVYWNATKCVNISGDRKPGESCVTVGGGTTGIDDCAKGAMCWNVDQNDGKGNCIALCGGSWESPVCPEEGKCTISGNAVLALCLPSCNPFLQDCPGDELCVPKNSDFGCIGDPIDKAGKANDSCENDAECDKGFLCIDSEAASALCDPPSGHCCQPFCKLPDGLCPNPDQECIQVFDPATLRPGDPALEVGICKIPS